MNTSVFRGRPRVALCNLHYLLKSRNQRIFPKVRLKCQGYRMVSNGRRRHRPESIAIDQSQSPKKHQVILGIETSCDDTGAAVVRDDGKVLGEALNTQSNLHLKFGGVIPTVARRLHADNIETVVKTALEKSHLSIADVDAIATTVKPGMKHPLKVGNEFGKKLALDFNKPFIPIHHMEAHALTIRMVQKVEFPFLVLLISGGHSVLALAKSLDSWPIIGQSIDIAPGDILDKGARRLKLKNLPECSTISGGQAIEHMAKGGDPRAYDLLNPMSRFRDCSFSYCGLESNLVKLIHKLEREQEIEGGRLLPQVKDLCASYQYGITKHIVRRTQRGMIYAETRELLPPDNRTLVVSGGVACNQYIRNALKILCDVMNFKLLCPPPKLCTDNGIMIAWNGMERWQAKTGVLFDKEDIKSVDIQTRCPLGEDLTEDVRSLHIPVNWVKFK